ncbi:hypothetical protein NDU88_006513 [Pleurodeles waltl]|uniref:Uncharacterized protein n=1 Tax=Pleurodeles waltl TaxID=8319 RepID=A0AAV7QIZ3_PLEWA|nr:hypothetical protein NDU88_006513 [Pleurodeles waltl]
MPISGNHMFLAYEQLPHPTSIAAEGDWHRSPASFAWQPAPHIYLFIKRLCNQMIRALCCRRDVQDNSSNKGRYFSADPARK